MLDDVYVDTMDRQCINAYPIPPFCNSSVGVEEVVNSTLCAKKRSGHGSQPESLLVGRGWGFGKSWGWKVGPAPAHPLFWTAASRSRRCNNNNLGRIYILRPSNCCTTCRYLLHSNTPVCAISHSSVCRVVDLLFLAEHPPNHLELSRSATRFPLQ